MTLKYTQVADFNQEFFNWFLKRGVSIRNAKELQDVFYRDYTLLPVEITNPYEHAFEFGPEDFNFVSFENSDWHRENNTPIGLRHIQSVKNGPKFEFLCGWMGGGDYPDVMVIFYLNENRVPSLYIPISGNPVNPTNGIVYEHDDNAITNYLDESGDFIHSFDKMRRELHNVFGFKA